MSALLEEREKDLVEGDGLNKENEKEDSEDDFIPPKDRLITPLDVCSDWTEDMLEMTCLGTMGIKITLMKGLEKVPNLTNLSLRSNLIRKLEGLENNVNLTHLELYDNKIKKGLENVLHLKQLIVLDISFNEIKFIPDLSSLSELRELYIANNKLTEIQGLEGLVNLIKLDIGSNKIRVLEGVNNCTQLKELWCGRNKIKKIEGISNLVQLNRLDVQNNRIVSIQGLDTLVNLEELYLASNGIEVIEGLTFCNKLNTLDLSRNKLSKVTGISHLIKLEELWLSSNEIKSFDDIEDIVTMGSIKPCSLRTIYLEHNELSKDFEYRKKLKQLVPSLVQIDATYCVISRNGIPMRPVYMKYSQTTS